MQAIHINITPMDDEAHQKYLSSLATDRVVLSASQVFQADFLDGVTAGGNSAVALWTHECGDYLPVFYLTAANVIRLAGAIRGRMAARGEMNVGVNPPLAISTLMDDGLIHFVFETPFQEFDYTPDEAAKLLYHLEKAIKRVRR